MMTRPETQKRKKVRQEDEVSDTEMLDETIDVTFEFCDLNPIDYHALKHLISQLFCITTTASLGPVLSKPSVPVLPSKAQLKPVPKNIDIGELTDILLGEQKEWIGVTVKCDDEGSDPYAFATVLDMRAHQTKPSVSALKSYLLSSLASNLSCPESQNLLVTLNEALTPEGKGIGLLLSERLINMPIQVMPQLFTQIGSEIKNAQSKNAPGFLYDKILIPSRVFFPHAESHDANQANPSFDPVELPNQQQSKAKRNKLQKAPAGVERCLYHPEDHIISQFSSHTVHFTLPVDEGEMESKIADGPVFGVKQEGRLMLIELSKWDEMTRSLVSYIGVQP